MTHLITGRVVRTSLPLLLLGACGTTPVLTAAMPGTAYARLPPADGGPRDDGTPNQLWRNLDRPNTCSGAVMLGPLLPSTETSGFVPPTLPPTLLELIDARLKTPSKPGTDFLGIDLTGRTNMPPELMTPQWSHQDVWSNGAPLLLLEWPGTAPAPGAPDALRHDGVQRVANAKADGDWAALSSKVALRERDDRLDPSVRNTWETDESLRMPLGGQLFLFGQLGASSPSVEQQQLKWLGKTGVGVKVKPWLLEEVQVRGGPAVRYDDTSLSRGQSPERSELFLEAVTKLPLPVVGPLNVEYTSYAVPAATPSDRNQINQDFKLAVPLSSGGQLQVGAKYKWENAAGATPWVDRMQLYMGVQLKR
jgi:hypothetical protein